MHAGADSKWRHGYETVQECSAPGCNSLRAYLNPPANYCAQHASIKNVGVPHYARGFCFQLFALCHKTMSCAPSFQYAGATVLTRDNNVFCSCFALQCWGEKKRLCLLTILTASLRCGTRGRDYLKVRKAVLPLIPVQVVGHTHTEFSDKKLHSQG